MAEIEYPFRKLPSAGTPSVEAAQTLERQDSASGRPRATRAAPKAFDARERASVVDEPLIADAMTQRFIYAHIERGASSGDVLRSVVDSVRRAPSTRNLERMRAVANEVGRRRGGGRELRKVLTQELVDEIIDRSYER